MGNKSLGVVVLLTMGASVSLLPACSSSGSTSGSTVVTGSGLATSCSTNDDCTGVYFGDVCEAICGLPNAAIASSAEATYQDTFNAAESRCPPTMFAGSCANDSAITTCVMGTCTLTTCPGFATSAHSCNDAGVVGSDAGYGPCTLSPSDYDQSCAVDSDCVLVTTGNYCGVGCLCATGTVNASASAAFNAVVATTPVAMGVVRAGDCPCAPVIGPCCRQGQCTTSCQSAADTLPACADAGGTCVFVPPSGMGSTCEAGAGGPLDLCAYPDETCCP